MQYRIGEPEPEKKYTLKTLKKYQLLTFIPLKW